MNQHASDDQATQSPANEGMSPEAATSDDAASLVVPLDRPLDRANAEQVAHVHLVDYAARNNQRIWIAGTLVYGAMGLVLLFCWLLWGDFALSMRDRSVGPLIEKFLLKNGAGNTLKQLLTATLPTVIGLILGPAISYRSDRTRSRWGRRIPYLIIPTPIAGLAMIAIAFSPQIGQWLYTATGHTPAAGVSAYDAAANYTLAIFAVLWTIFEVAVIISGAVFGGLINDVVPRPVLGRFHGLFRAVSLFDGILFNAILFQHAEQHFTLMFAMIGLLFGGGFTLMCLKVKEGNYPPVVDREAPQGFTPVGVGAVDPNAPLVRANSGSAGAVDFLSNFYRAAIIYLRECFSQPYYLLCFAMLTLSGLTFRPSNDFAIRYAAQLKLADADYGFLVAISYVVSLILAFPLGMLVDRFHPIRMTLMAIILYALTALYGCFYVHDARTFGVALVAHTILSGTFFTCVASLGQQLLPRSKYSQYASAGGIITSLVSLVFAPAIGGVLDLTHNNYHLTYWVGLALSLLTIAVTLAVYRKFKSYGGTKAYLAPDDDDLVPALYEPPANLPQIVLLYSIGAAIGVAAGYGLSILVFHLWPGGLPTAGVGFTNFHTLIMSNSDVRNHSTLCIATGVIPFAILGGWAGTYLAKRQGPAGAAAHH